MIISLFKFKWFRLLKIKNKKINYINTTPIYIVCSVIIKYLLLFRWMIYNFIQLYFVCKDFILHIEKNIHSFNKLLNKNINRNKMIKDLYRRDSYWWTPLYNAYDDGNLKRVKYILSFKNMVLKSLNKTDYDGHTPLYIACRYGNIVDGNDNIDRMSEKIVKYLLSFREVIHRSLDEHGHTPLYLACEHGNIIDGNDNIDRRSEKIVKYLFKK